MSDSCINVTTFFWPFVRMVVGYNYNYVSHSQLYNLISKYAYEDHTYKININSLYEVYNFDKLNECDAIMTKDYIIFKSFQSLFHGMNKLYSYQNNSEHKMLITKCLKIMEETTEKIEQNNLSDMMNNINL